MADAEMTTAALLLRAGLVLISAGLKALDRHDAALCEFANVTDDDDDQAALAGDRRLGL